MLEYGINIDAENVGWTALHLAALNGHLDIVSILLNKGASTAIRNREGKTALDIAREEGQERIAAIILETEFQSGASELPSPPPTPPSAPPIEFFGARGTEGTLGTLEQWRVKLQRDLEEVSRARSMLAVVRVCQVEEYKWFYDLYTPGYKEAQRAGLVRVETV